MRHKTSTLLASTLAVALAVPIVAAAPRFQVRERTVRDGVPPARMSDTLSRLARHRANGPDRERAERVEVVVVYHDGASARAAELRSTRTSRHRFSKFPYRSLSVSVDELDRLANDPRVKYVARDSEVTLASKSAYKTANAPHSLGQGNADGMFGYDGSGVSVAVVDTGANSDSQDIDSIYHYGLRTSKWFGKNLYYESAYDPNGHGTHVASIIAGDGSGSNGDFRGVAPGARVFSLRVLDGEGKAMLSDVLFALERLLARHNVYGIRVVNLSMGKAVEDPVDQDPLVQAVDALWDAGVVVVCSAGNYGDNGHFTVTSPGNSPKVITVGALDDKGSNNPNDDTVASYSSQGPTLYDHVVKPDLLAPGSHIVASSSPKSTIHHLLEDDLIDCSKEGNSQACSGNGEYVALSGTSMAAAMVTGTVALMLDRDPTLTPDNVKGRLMLTANKMPGDPTIVGTGVLDIKAAMKDTTYVANARSPQIARSDEGPVLLIEDPRLTWGSEFGAEDIWGDAYLWKDAFLWVDGYLWMDAYLWQDAFLWVDAYLWQEAFLWMDAFLWVDNVVWSDAVQGGSPLIQSQSAQELGIDVDLPAPPPADERAPI